MNHTSYTYMFIMHSYILYTTCVYNEHCVSSGNSNLRKICDSYKYIHMVLAEMANIGLIISTQAWRSEHIAQ